LETLIKPDTKGCYYFLMTNVHMLIVMLVFFTMP